MDELIQRQQPAEHRDDTIVPAVRGDFSIFLAPDEVVRWAGMTDVQMLRYNDSLPDGGAYEFAWNLVDRAHVLITTGRLIYRANTLSKNKGFLAGFWEGALHATNEHKFLRPDAYVGQVRFEWAANVMLHIPKKFGITLAQVMVTVLRPHAGPLRLICTFRVERDGMTSGDAYAFATALTRDIAEHRLRTRAEALQPAEVSTVIAQRSAGLPSPTDAGGTRWDLPGAVPIPTARLDSAQPVPEQVRDAETNIPPGLLAQLDRALDRLEAS